MAFVQAWAELMHLDKGAVKEEALGGLMYALPQIVTMTDSNPQETFRSAETDQKWRTSMLGECVLYYFLVAVDVEQCEQCGIMAQR